MKTKIMGALALTVLIGATAFGQATATKEATSNANMFNSGVLEGSSIQLYNRLTVKDSNASYMFSPHFTMPIINKWAKIDIFADFTGFDKRGSKVGVDTATGAYIQKTLVDNKNLYLEPYINIGNWHKKGTTIAPTFMGVVKAPIKTSIGTFEPFLYNETNATFRTAAGTFSDTQSVPDRAVLGAVATAVPNATILKPKKLPINVWNRVAVSYVPNGLEGLKLTAGVEVNYDANVPATFVQGTTNVVDYKDSLSSQPIFRVDYKINDKLALRNHTAIPMTNFLDKYATSAGGRVTNYTRLIYTIF